MDHKIITTLIKISKIQSPKNADISVGRLRFDQQPLDGSVHGLGCSRQRDRLRAAPGRSLRSKYPEWRHL